MDYYSQIYHKNSSDYKKLREEAFHINNVKNESRNQKWCRASDWSKQKLTDIEKAYLYQSYKGVCSNTNCQKKLTEKTFTVEHIMPKCRHIEDMWKLDNFSILCSPCNSKKNNRHIQSIPYKPGQKKIRVRFNSAVGPKAKRWYGGVNSSDL